MRFMRFAADKKKPVTSFQDENVETTEGYTLLNLEAAGFSSFPKNQNQPFA